MHQTIPEAKLALQSLEKSIKLNKSDITELKSLHKPPTVVVKVVSAVYKLLNPLAKTSEITWEKCKAMMAEPAFLYVSLASVKHIDASVYDGLLEFTSDKNLAFDE